MRQKAEYLTILSKSQLLGRSNFFEMAPFALSALAVELGLEKGWYP